MSVIHEAAALGNETKMPEVIVSNDPDAEEDWDPETAAQTISERRRQLLELNTQAGEGQKKVEKLVLVRKEDKPAEHLLVKPMQAYSNIEDVKLPRQAPPKIDPVKNAAKLSKMKQEAVLGGRPMIDISAAAAEVAWGRRARLDRPGSLPKMEEVGDCPFCGPVVPTKRSRIANSSDKGSTIMSSNKTKKSRTKLSASVRSARESAKRNESSERHWQKLRLRLPRPKQLSHRLWLRLKMRQRKNPQDHRRPHHRPKHVANARLCNISLIFQA